MKETGALSLLYFFLDFTDLDPTASPQPANNSFTPTQPFFEANIPLRAEEPTQWNSRFLSLSTTLSTTWILSQNRLLLYLHHHGPPAPEPSQPASPATSTTSLSPRQGQRVCCLELNARPSATQTQSVNPVGYIACGSAGTAQSWIDFGRKEEGRAWSVSAAGYIGVQMGLVVYYYCSSCEGSSGGWCLVD